jgi:hypothetical protein
METFDEANEKAIVEKLRGLPPDKRKEVLDFVDFLASRGKVEKWLEFDEWAMNLAKAKGFSKLKDEDIAQIVDDLRSGR